jgi:hypothetical protein
MGSYLNWEEIVRQRVLFAATIASVLCLLTVPQAHAELLYDLDIHRQGDILSDAPDYVWWYGCSPTSAGMMMGYYDIHGYGGLSYDNLVPGGTAELISTNGPPAAIPAPLAQEVIASAGHINDFYRSGYLGSGDDLPAPHHDFDSLADFMGTSQDSVGNVNGSTTFVYYINGAKTPASHLDGTAWADRDGMYGMWEYFDYAGYGDVDSKDDFFNQYIVEAGETYGFSWDQYMAEIDAGRVVMLHVTGHSMFGYGYGFDLATESRLVYFHDTWDPLGQHSMVWGGSYAGMDHYGVTAFTPTGGTEIPEPSTLLLFGAGLLASGWLGRRRRS